MRVPKSPVVLAGVNLDELAFQVITLTSGQPLRRGSGPEATGVLE